MGRNDTKSTAEKRREALILAVFATVAGAVTAVLGGFDAYDAYLNGLGIVPGILLCATGICFTIYAAVAHKSLKNRSNYRLRLIAYLIGCACYIAMIIITFNDETTTSLWSPIAFTIMVCVIEPVIKKVTEEGRGE